MSAIMSNYVSIADVWMIQISRTFETSEIYQDNNMWVRFRGGKGVKTTIDDDTLTWIVNRFNEDDNYSTDVKMLGANPWIDDNRIIGVQIIFKAIDPD